MNIGVGAKGKNDQFTEVHKFLSSTIVRAPVSFTADIPNLSNPHPMGSGDSSLWKDVGWLADNTSVRR
jgi:hypothetical protein